MLYKVNNKSTLRTNIIIGSKSNVIKLILNEQNILRFEIN